MVNLKQDIFSSQENEDLDIKREISYYSRFWPYFVLSILFFLASAFFYTRYAPRVFQSNAKIKILDEDSGLELPTAGFVFNRSNINLENEIEVLSSYIILNRVVNHLNLDTEFFEIGRVQTSQIANLPFHFERLSSVDTINDYQSYTIKILSNQFHVIDEKNANITKIPNFNSSSINHELPFNVHLLNEIEISSLVDKQYKVVFVPTKHAILKLKNSLKISPIGKQSDLLQLSLSGESFELSESILNTTLKVFNYDGIQDRQLISERTINFIDDRFKYLAKELDSVEITYQGFKERNDLVDISSDVALGLEQRTEAEAELFKLENQIELAKLLEESLNDDNGNNLLPSNIGLENKSINSLISDYNLAVLQKDKLLNSAGENNPSLLNLSGSIKELKLIINKSLKVYLQQLMLSKQQFQTRAVFLTSKVSSIPEKERLLKNIVRQQQIKESLYLLLLQKREEAAINLASHRALHKIVEYALTSSVQSPKKKIIYLELSCWVLFPFCFISVFMLDTKVHTREDIEKVTTNIPILAEIPEIKKKGSLLFTNPNATSVLAESFRILSANVDYVLPKNDDKSKGKVIFSTSTIKGEGKTFVSLNLSLALASLNKKVLLIGADMRNPQIHTYFGTSKNQLGLSSYLNDASVNWKELLMSGFDKHPKHYTMLSGAIPPNPAHLLTNGRFEQLLAEARTEFDYVIVDTAPTILVTDTLLISKFADVTLFLTKANYTDKKLLKFSKELSESGKIKNMAYVMNSVGAGNSYSYGYGYGYNYGYSYGYHEEN